MGRVLVARRPGTLRMVPGTHVRRLSFRAVLLRAQTGRPGRTDSGGVVSAANRGWSCGDRKSTRLNSSHVRISYAVFCLKKKNARTLPLAMCRATLGRL